MAARTWDDLDRVWGTVMDNKDQTLQVGDKLIVGDFVRLAPDGSDEVRDYGTAEVVHVKHDPVKPELQLVVERRDGKKCSASYRRVGGPYFWIAEDVTREPEYEEQVQSPILTFHKKA